MIATTNPSLSRTTIMDAEIDCGEATLNGELTIPVNAKGVVLFVHGPGSSRHSPRNERVAQTLRSRGMGTLLFDLLSSHEELDDSMEKKYRFDISLLAR